MQWQWCSFQQLSIDQLYEILRARQEVFTVEQDCPYQDADGKDQEAWHLICWDKESQSPQLVAYLRVVFPGKKYSEPSIGRVLTAESSRGTGLGRELIRRAVEQTQAEYPGSGIRISAQEHLRRFYGEFGFEQVSAPYDEDGIPHIEMLRPASE
ncbi:GNAT family N-acetyltransferase [Microbulbifer sp. THAF38]|uniref:GNAT family N-acetyltransferase n=1 Tax=Microbulbifer sp. THAF38 TaxID=2587856 RepID=UPI0012A78B78|nr:GNAT family N-acetyltransferase [Microbulbifer sp. THAF38]QFT55529.1 putative acyltransferase [Microbulbifer sp. THAF38]